VDDAGRGLGTLGLGLYRLDRGRDRCCCLCRRSARVTAYGDDDGVRHHDGEDGYQCQEKAHSIPSHVEVSVASWRTACSLPCTVRQQRRGHELILPCRSA
jgi:hypothetical protein